MTQVLTPHSPTDLLEGEKITEPSKELPMLHDFFLGIKCANCGVNWHSAPPERWFVEYCPATLPQPPKQGDPT